MGGEKCRGHAQEYGGARLKSAEGMRRDWAHGAEKMWGLARKYRVHGDEEMWGLARKYRVHGDEKM